MKVYRLHREHVIRRPIEEVFAFFERADNLERITPPSLRFRVVTPPPIAMHAGTLIDYELRIRGLPVHWRTLISDYDPPQGFIDQQIKGPYALWHHRHRFEAVAGETLMTDTVHYALGWGVLGRLAHAAFVRAEVAGIFDYRARVIEELLGAAGAMGGDATGRDSGLMERERAV